MNEIESTPPGKVSGPSGYDADALARYFDSFGVHEWERLVQSPSDEVSLYLHTYYLEKHIVKGQRVLEVGAGAAVLLRVFWMALPGLQMDWSLLFWVLAVLTMTIGNVVALDALVDLRVAEGGVEREAVAQVRWANGDRGKVTQLYHLGLVQRDGRWYVGRLGLAPGRAAKEMKT